MSDTPRKDAISAQIDTLLASGKTQKISAYDHRTVATSIVNYIDNRILTAGSATLSGWANRDAYWYITFTAPVGTANYTVIGSPTATVGNTNMSRTVTVVKSKTTTGFMLLGMTPWPTGGITVIYDYIIIANLEQQ